MVEVREIFHNLCKYGTGGPIVLKSQMLAAHAHFGFVWEFIRE